MYKKFTLRFLLIVLVFGTGNFKSSAQQLIGSFPYMDGGFEGQTVGSLGTTLSATAWTRQSASSSIVTTTPRTGLNFASVTNTATVSRGLQSPQTATVANGPSAATAYVIQYYVRNASTVNSYQDGVNTNGTGNTNYSTAATLSANAGWTKRINLVTSASTAPTTAGILVIGRSAAGSFDVDDAVIYQGASADNTAPNSPGTVTVSNPTVNSLDVSWTAATGGVDGGGYVVVRYASNPNLDNDPNQNGLYAVNNTTLNGTGSLVGTFRYIGTGTSFTDNVGLSSTQTYYYKVYTVDKAFNYSAESLNSGTTSTPATPTLTASSLADFGSVCVNTIGGPNSFTLNGTALDGTNVTVGSLSGFTYSTVAGGPYTNTLTLGAGTTYPLSIYVNFTPTVITPPYNGNITISGGGSSSITVVATGTGYSAQVTTSSSSSITATSATIAGIINSSCTLVSSYGFEYSTNSGFANGTGTQVIASNLSGGNFSASTSGLAPNTRYYYKAFVSNSGGTVYGTQLAFTCTPLPVIMSAQTGLSFTETFADIANWSNFFISGVGANHFSGLGATGSGGIPNGITTTSSTFSFQTPNLGPPVTPSASGGVHKGTDQTVSTQSLLLLTTGTTDNTTSAAIDFYLDFTGVNANTLSFDYAVVNNSTGDRNSSLRVYGSIDGTTFTEILNAAVLDFKNNVAFSGTKTNIQLPSSFNNNPNARLRFYYSNGAGGTTGSRPKISIDNLNVTAVATTPCATPTAAATALSFGTITDVSIQGSFVAANPATDSYLIVMSTNSSLISNPVNGQAYNIGDNVGDGSVISKGTTTSFTATGLTAQTTYYFFVFPMNAICTGGPLYYTTTVLNGPATTVAGLPACVAPVSQPTNLTFGTPTSNTITGSFTATTADQYLIVRSTVATLTNNPVNGNTYNANDVLGNGIIVQSSAATTFNATGLTPNTPYYFFVFSLNNQGCVNGPAYNVTNPLTASQSTIPLPLCTTPTAQGSALSLTASNTSISGTFTGVSSADNYLIIKSTSATLGATPTDNTDYNAGDVFGNGIVLSNTTSTTFYAAALTANTTYYFFIFAANKTCSGGTKYATQPALSGNATTLNVGANNYYFGTLHSHSDYSDGNKDNAGFTPAQDYSYAKTSLCMDYLGISEHNHFSTLDNPGNQINNYHQGTIQANNFSTANPNFLALYGMEWGVISGGGHVVVYGDGMDDLWGWESGSGVWGSSNNYDTYVPKSTYTGSTGLFKTVNDNILKNTFATLAHPNLTDYNNIAGANIAYDVVADNAIVGAAVESGPAFSVNTAYSDPASSLSYLYYYQLLLSKGYHLGPTIDHDNHNTTFGRTTTSRTAIVSPSLTKTAIVSAMRNMNFYATQDCDTKVDFTINTKILGSLVSDRFGPNISVSLTDATNSVLSAIIRVMYGTPGSGISAVKIDSVIGSTLHFTDNNLANMATGYYYLDITNGTGRIITSPIWYTRNDAFMALPVKLSSFTAQKANTSAQLNWTTEQEINSSYFSIERSADGRNWSSILKVNAAGNSSIVKSYQAFDNAPLNGTNYYRLKQYDVDGKFEYSNVKSVTFNKAYNISIAPNPAKDFINIFATKNINEVLIVQLIDVNGKVIKSFQTIQRLINISTAGIAKGLYFIKVKDENTVNTQRIIIE